MKELMIAVAVVAFGVAVTGFMSSGSSTPDSKGGDSGVLTTIGVLVVLCALGYFFSLRGCN